jgi:hypothetical protein
MLLLPRIKLLLLVCQCSPCDALTVSVHQTAALLLLARGA